MLGAAWRRTKMHSSAKERSLRPIWAMALVTRTAERRAVFRLAYGGHGSAECVDHARRKQSRRDMARDRMYQPLATVKPTREMVVRIKASVLARSGLWNGYPLSLAPQSVRSGIHDRCS